MSPQKMAKKDKAAEMATSVDEQNQRNANQLIIGLQENYIAVKNELIRIDPNQILKENELNLKTKYNQIRNHGIIQFIYGVVIIAIAAIISIYKMPSELSIQNTINDTYKNYKADMKEYIDEAIQKQFKELKEELKKQK